MSVSLISQFHDLTKQIRQAAEIDDLDRVKKLDLQLVEVWKRLLAWRPRNPENIIVMAEFLVDQLIANPNTEHLQREIGDTILVLVRLARKLR